MSGHWLTATVKPTDVAEAIVGKAFEAIDARFRRDAKRAPARHATLRWYARISPAVAGGVPFCRNCLL